MLTENQRLSSRKNEKFVDSAGYTGGPLVIGLVTEWRALPATTWITAGTGLVAGLILLLLVPETLKRRTA